MMTNPLTLGEQPTLDQVLLARERRVDFQKRLAEKFDGKILTALKLNIPGPVKNNELIRDVFEQAVHKITGELLHRDIELLYVKEVQAVTGPEAFLITGGDLKEIKQVMMTMEENSPTGRLYDLDVMKVSGGKFESISREDLNLPQRRCLICGNSAKVCGRSRTHTVETMLDRILSLISEEKNL